MPLDGVTIFITGLTIVELHFQQSSKQSYQSEIGSQIVVILGRKMLARGILKMERLTEFSDRRYATMFFNIADGK